MNTPALPLPLEHQFLGRYVADWIRIALRAVRPPASGGEPLRLAYVAGFAAAEAGSSLAGEVPFDAARIAIRAFDAAGRPGRAASLITHVVLVEEDPVQLDRLRDALIADGFGERLCEPKEPAELPPGGVALVRAAARDALPRWTPFLQRCSAALSYLHPPAAANLPLETVRELLQQAGVDALIHFPAEALHRQARFRGVPIADLPGYTRRLVDGYSALFGDFRFEWLLQWRELELVTDPEAAERAMVGRYAERLGTFAPELRVKRMELVSADRPEERVHLLLAGRDPVRLLAANSALQGVHGSVRTSTDDAEPALVRVEETGELDLFGTRPTGPEPAGASAPAPSRRRSADLPAIADRFAARFAGRTVPFADVLWSVLETELFVEDVRRALALLKRDRRADFRALSLDAEVQFAALGARLARQSPRGSRSRDTALRLPIGEPAQGPE